MTSCPSLSYFWSALHLRELPLCLHYKTHFTSEKIKLKKKIMIKNEMTLSEDIQEGVYNYRDILRETSLNFDTLSV